MIRLGNPSAITLTANGVGLGKQTADQPLNVVFERKLNNQGALSGL